jgi:pseudouridine-5'-phosphate glycosidase
MHQFRLQPNTFPFFFFRKFTVRVQFITDQNKKIAHFNYWIDASIEVEGLFLT